MYDKFIFYDEKRTTSVDNEYKQIGYISTEGGPVLIGDYEIITKWNGIMTDDYEKLIEANEEDFIYKIADKNVVVWDPEGGACISIHCNNKDDFTFIKSFIALKDNDKYIDAIGQNEEVLGEVEIFSNTLLILYATESGALLEPLKDNSIRRLTGGLAFENSVLSIPVSNGIYRCVSDLVFDSEKLYQAKRLLLTKL